MMSSKPTCKQAAALLIAMQDRAIHVDEEEAVRLHMLACKACTNFEGQLLAMRNAFKQWRNYSDES